MRAAVLFAILGLAAAMCPNGCSGNGVCGANDKCSCYQNFQGADCSLRTCSFTLAWADTADGTNQAHYYAECGNKGLCDRKTGQCKCFDGYEGKGCRRSTCPDACSGHGTCEYIEELAGDYQDRRYGPGNWMQDMSCESARSTLADSSACKTGSLYTSTVTARNANTDVSHGHLYQLWDAGKIQGCKCDLGYDGPDCAHRISPHGDDPLTTVKSSMMKQVVQVQSTDASGFNTDPRNAEGFLMVYHDPYGGVWRTDEIIAGGSGDQSSSATGALLEDVVAASRVQDALRALPNNVLEGVTVKARTSNTVQMCTRMYDGVQHLGGFSETTDGNFKNSKMTTNFCQTTYTLPSVAGNKLDFTIEFADKPGQTGVQYLFEVDINKRGWGSFPTSGGLTGAQAAYSVAEMNHNIHLGNLSELAECSDRGLDDGDGACECFDGFRGLACEEQEALV